MDGAALQQLLFFALLRVRPVRARDPPAARPRPGARRRCAPSLEPGRRVMTTAGIHATVAGASRTGVVVLEIAPGVHVRFADAAVVRLLDEPGDRRADRVSLTELLRSQGRRRPRLPDARASSSRTSRRCWPTTRRFVAAVDAVVAAARDDRIDKVVGIEARGFLLAAPAAYHLGAGFVPVRKPGKLPGPTRETSYDLEYGSNVLQVHLDAFAPGERVLVVDDVLATGGTAAAAGRLVQRGRRRARRASACCSSWPPSAAARAAGARPHPGVPVARRC